MFIGCEVPVFSCNFRCQYCYLASHEDAYIKGVHAFVQSPEMIAKYFSIDRTGGPCYFNFCGAGETLMHPQLLDLIELLTKEGHYCDIITNGTLSKKFDEISKRFSGENHAHLMIKFSFHYLQLVQRNMLDKFVENVNKMKNAGISYSVEITPHDELIPYIDEIKKFSIANFGALPHITVARNEETKSIDLLSSMNREAYEKTWSVFDSKMFDFKLSIFNQPRCEFCYAGAWSLLLDLETGDYFQCYRGDRLGNITKDNQPIHRRPIGKCREPHCFNGHAYLTYGDIPTLNTPAYAEMRDRVTEDGRHWLQDDTRKFFSTKLKDSNVILSNEQQKMQEFQNSVLRGPKYLENLYYRGIRKIKNYGSKQRITVKNDKD